MHKIKPGQFYRHFKGQLYQILAVAEHTETGEQMVVYQALYEDYRVYVRPYEMFVSPVDKEKYPKASQEFRFEQVEFSKKTLREVAQEPVSVHRESARVSDPDQVSPLLLEFLDAKTLEEKLHLLAYHRNEMTDQLLNNIAISLDLVVEKKNLQEKYDEIMNCLSTMERFECHRLR